MSAAFDESIGAEGSHHPQRDHLGGFVSIVCFKQALKGAEDALGAAARVGLIAAGRARGNQLVTSLGLAGTITEPTDALPKLQAALGADGTRLCEVMTMELEGEDYRIKLRDAIETWGEDASSTQECSYTLGALQGALKTLTNRKWRGKHVVKAQTNGGVDEFLFQLL
ncbi:MAG: hypothetical protein EP330_26360 [Deltaproteobacteria bacterium]|nr:MAG: hypothetical protein EP330_26360 [Deltaproteobacteria bacterium]